MAAKDSQDVYWTQTHMNGQKYFSPALLNTLIWATACMGLCLVSHSGRSGGSGTSYGRIVGTTGRSNKSFQFSVVPTSALCAFDTVSKYVLQELVWPHPGSTKKANHLNHAFIVLRFIQHLKHCRKRLQPKQRDHQPKHKASTLCGQQINTCGSEGQT